MRTILIALAAMLIGGTAYAGDVIAPPITKYVEAPLPPKRPTNFGKIDNQKVNKRIVELTTRK
jgi:hypothetical protein